MSRSLLTRLGAWPSLLALILTAAPATAQTNYFWNAPAGGDGTWDLTATNWATATGGPVNYVWGTNPGQERANFGDTAGTVTLGVPVSAFGLNFTTTGYTITGSTLTLDGAGGVIDTGSGNATINSIIAGSVGLTKAGTGTLSLGGANTYTGVTAVNAGVVAVTNATGLGGTGAGNNTSVGSGAAVQVDGGITVAEAITLSGTGVSNDGALRSTAGNNTWSGAVTLGSATRINSDAGTLTISGAVGGGTNSLTVGGAGNTTISGQITMSGTLTHDSASTLTISNTSNSTLTGPITVTNGGVLAYQSQLALGNAAGAGVITLDNGTLRNTLPTGNAGTFSPNNRNIVLGAGGGTLEWAGTATPTDIIIVQNTAPGTVISGVGGLNKTGAGIIAVGMAATYQGPTHVIAGTLRVRNANNIFPIGTALTVDGGATFDLDIRSQEVGSLAGAGTVKLSGASSSGQLLTVGNLNTSTVFSGQLTEGTITGGRLTKVGTGTLTLSGSGSYTGATTVSAGTLAAGANNAFAPLSAFTVASGAVIDLAGFNQTMASLAGAGNATLGSATLTVGGTANATHSGVISGTGSLVKQGTGTQSLSGANTYTGGTTISAGTLQIGAGGTTGSIAGDVTNNGTLQFNRSNIYTFGGVISGSGAVTQAGSSRVDLTGANTYTGVTRVNNGVLTFNSIANVGGGSSALGAPTTAANGTISVGNTVTAATLRYTGSTDVSTDRVINMAGTTGSAFLESSGTGAITFTSNLTATGSGIKNLNLIGSNTGANTIAGVIPDSAGGATSLVKNGAGTWVLTGANTYTGTTTVVAGTLRLGAANTLPAAGAVNLNGGTLSSGETTGFGQTVGALSVNTSSTLALGTGSHTLTFASFGTLGAGEILTITGWVGDPGTSGTAGRLIFTDTSGLTSGVLASINFTGDPDFGSGAMLFGNELVPVPVPEPATVMAVAAAGLGLGGLVRRLRRRSTALAA